MHLDQTNYESRAGRELGRRGHAECRVVVNLAGTSGPGRAESEFWLWHLFTGDPSPRVWPQGCIRKKGKGLLLDFTLCRAVVSWK